MALTIDLSLAISTDRTTATITDNTVYGTGGNPARNAVACYLTAYKVDVDGNETALTVTSDDDDPETDSVWTITLDVDGHYKFPFVIIPDFNSSGTLAQYDAVYSSGSVYRSKTNSNTEDTLSNTTYYESISDPSDLANNKDTSTESENITSQVYVRVLSPNGQYDFANKLSNISLYMDNDDLEFSIGEYNLYAQWLDAVAVADSRSEVVDGELICRRIQSKFIDASN